MTPLEQEPFTRYHEEKRADTFTVRVNEEERKMIEELKELMNVKQDSKALKVAAKVGLNVLLSSFGKDTLRYLFKKDREKLEDYKSF